MTREELYAYAFRCCEARLRKSGPVFSEAEIMEDFPVSQIPPIAQGQWSEMPAVEDAPFIPLDAINEREITPEAMASRIEAAHETMRQNATKAMYGDLGLDDVTRLI